MYMMSLNFTGNIIQVKTHGAAVCPTLSNNLVALLGIYNSRNLNDSDLGVYRGLLFLNVEF